MIKLAKQHLVNVPPLGSDSEALLGQTFIEEFTGLWSKIRCHAGKLPCAKGNVNT